jgi:hypothetical protein
LSCLILDHLLWPDIRGAAVENGRHLEQIYSVVGKGDEKVRRPLENAAIASFCVTLVSNCTVRPDTGIFPDNLQGVVNDLASDSPARIARPECRKA